jgi:serine phosphatase RsbU (regulator of sigma subunit)
VTVRRRLLVNLVALVLLLGGAILAATFFGNHKTVRTLSAELIARARRQTRAELQSFFEPVVRQLRVLEDQARSGVLTRADPAAEDAALVPVLDVHPQVSSLMVADDHGREHMLLHAGRAWRARRTDADAWGRRAEWREWTDDDPTGHARSEDLGYDPRVRPWFQGAKARLEAHPDAPWSQRLHWTAPYTFYTTKEPGITASLAWRDARGLVHVVGLDVLLRDLSVFTTGTDLQVSEHGLVALVDEKTSEVLGLPRTAPFLTDEGRRGAVRRTLEDLGVSALGEATAAAPAARAGGPFRFRSGGQAWWGDVSRYPLSEDRALRILVVVPEADLLGGLGGLRGIILAVVVLALLLAVWRAWMLSDRLGEPLEALVAASDRIAQGDLEEGAPIVSDLREVRSLAEAQERMRVGLQTLLKLERDLQVARQIQQNTFPGTLPGLPGFAVEGWSEPADETGGDTYDVIGLSGDWARASVVASEAAADRAVLMLADATGHGIGPALSALQLRAMLRMAMRMRGDLGTIARHMNAQLCEDLPGARFLTTWLGMLDPGEGTLRTFSAGQAPLLHYHAATDEAEVLSADAPPFGILRNLPVEIGAPVPLAPGDLYVVLSDGIYEAQDPDGAKFGTRRVVEVVRAHRTDAPREILAALRKAVAAFARGRPADDDRTAILVKRL